MIHISGCQPPSSHRPPVQDGIAVDCPAAVWELLLSVVSPEQLMALQQLQTAALVALHEAQAADAAATAVQQASRGGMLAQHPPAVGAAVCMQCELNRSNLLHALRTGVHLCGSCPPIPLPFFVRVVPGAEAKRSASCPPPNVLSSEQTAEACGLCPEQAGGHGQVEGGAAADGQLC